MIIQCHRGVKQCVKRKGGLSCLWGKCKTYNVCAECNKDSDCKRFLGLDVSLTPTTQQTKYLELFQHYLHVCQDCIRNMCYLRDYFRDPVMPVWTYPTYPVPAQPGSMPAINPIVRGGHLQTVPTLFHTYYK